MCVSIPSKIVSVADDGPMPMAVVEVEGMGQRPCCLAYVPEARVGDYVIVQNGFAIHHLDPQSAAESLAAFAELGYFDAPVDELLGGSTG
jgi:hydrogenase expression/formation protein HypC